MSHERTIAVLRVRRPRSAASKFVCPVGSKTPGQSTSVSKSACPSSTAAAAEITLNVDAGAYAPCVARNSSGDPRSASSSASYAWALMPPVNADGSYDGVLASASTRPVRASITTTEPESARVLPPPR